MPTCHNAHYHCNYYCYHYFLFTFRRDGPICALHVRPFVALSNRSFALSWSRRDWMIIFVILNLQEYSRPALAMHGHEKWATGNAPCPTNAVSITGKVIRCGFNHGKRLQNRSIKNIFSQAQVQSPKCCHHQDHPCPAGRDSSWREDRGVASISSWRKHCST